MATGLRRDPGQRATTSDARAGAQEGGREEAQEEGGASIRGTAPFPNGRQEPCSR